VSCEACGTIKSPEYIELQGITFCTACIEKYANKTQPEYKWVKLRLEK